MFPPPDDRAGSMHPGRRLALAATVALAAGCATRVPATDWIRLPLDFPAALTGSLPKPGEQGAMTAAVWQLVLPLELPGHLGRDAVIAAQGPTRLTALAGARWAEPLRDAVPRVLRADLARALGTEVWTVPLPPGVVPTRQLRVAIDALDAAADGRLVELRARWSIADPGGASTPVTGGTTIEVRTDAPRGHPGTGRSAEASGAPRSGQAASAVAVDAHAESAQALAVACREALARLALRIAGNMQAAAGRPPR